MLPINPELLWAPAATVACCSAASMAFASATTLPIGWPAHSCTQPGAELSEALTRAIEDGCRARNRSKLIVRPPCIAHIPQTEGSCQIRSQLPLITEIRSESCVRRSARREPKSRFFGKEALAVSDQNGVNWISQRVRLAGDRGQ